jgi:hypothetical protein
MRVCMRGYASSFGRPGGLQAVEGGARFFVLRTVPTGRVSASGRSAALGLFLKNSATASAVL